MHGGVPFKMQAEFIKDTEKLKCIFHMLMHYEYILAFE